MERSGKCAPTRAIRLRHLRTAKRRFNEDITHVVLGTAALAHGDAVAAKRAFEVSWQLTVPQRAIFARGMIPMPEDKYNRLGLLAVYAGPRVVQFTLDAKGDEPITATRPRLERLARLVLPRLR